MYHRTIRLYIFIILYNMELINIYLLQVVWDPHRSIREDRPILDIAFFSGCLKCIDVVEPYHPERVLRQFGRIQMIPRTPLAPTRASRGSTVGSYCIVYVFLDQM